MKQSRNKIFLAMFGTLISGCAAVENFFDKDLKELPNYRLSAGDLVKVEVSETRQQVNLQISQSGELSYPPFFKKIQASGLTVAELSQTLSSKWQGNAAKPKPKVNVTLYHFQEGDTVHLNVVGKHTFNTTVTIDDAGMVSHPKLGELRVANLTPEDVEQLVTTKLKVIYPEDRPQVMVALLGNKQVQAVRTSLPKAANAPTSSPAPGPSNSRQQGQGAGKDEDTTNKGRQVGPFLAYPEVGTTVVHDSNIFQSPDNERSSLVFTINPGLKLEKNWQGNSYALALASPIGIYADSSNDNYVDGQFSAQADWKLPRSLGFKFLGEYLRGHDSRGATDRPDTGEPNTWHSGRISVTGSYGRKETRARLEVGGNFTLKRYDQFGLPEKLDDKNIANLNTTLFYQILPKTYLLGRIQYASTDYVSSLSTADSQEMKYSIGATWDATAKTSANIELGYSNRSYDTTGVENVSGIYWNAGVQWKPLNHSILDLTTSKFVDDATGIGSYISQQNVGVAWKHKWSPRILSSANFSIGTFDYGGSSRNDDLYNYGVNLTYQYRKWLNVGTGVQMNHRDSNNDDFDYDKTVFSVNLRATF